MGVGNILWRQSPDVRAFFEDQTPSLDPDKWKDMFFKPVVDIRDFVQRKVRSTRRKRRCDSPSKNFVFITDEI